MRWQFDLFVSVDTLGLGIALFKDHSRKGNGRNWFRVG